MQGDRVERVLSDPRSQTDQGTEVYERREHNPFYSQELDTMQERFSLRPIALDSLLLAQRINIRIAPIGQGSPVNT